MAPQKHATLLIFIFCMAAHALPAQKLIEAIYTPTPLKIDGELNEPIWGQSPGHTGFVERRPVPGNIATQKTLVKVLYNDTYLYIGAYLYESSTDSVLMQLTLRDGGKKNNNTLPFQEAIADWFGVVIDCYKEGRNAMGFAVAANGVQYDSKYLEGSIDHNWDAVWKSAVSFGQDSWRVEMAIPFSALRFPDNAEQIWNVNFVRVIRRAQKELWWNEISPEKEGFLNQFGTLRIARAIAPPIRLQAAPYLAYSIETLHDNSAVPANTSNQKLAGGLDIKYGLNEAFTLDASLVPNFGEAFSDKQVLNLAPFEIRFDDYRPFFTESLELFQKGGIFYTRRIGGTPLHYGDINSLLEEGETLKSNPSETPVYNAVKLSGRTSKGWGIGVLNAIVGKTSASVLNVADMTTRKVQTSPATNYNILVFDKSLANNSSVSLTNANTLRLGNDHNANTTALSYSINNKSRMFNAAGGLNLSQLYYKNGARPSLGHLFNMNLKKTGGNLTYGLEYKEVSSTYDPNDLGFISNNNVRDFNASIRYTNFRPKGTLSQYYVDVFIGYGRLYMPSKYSHNALQLKGNATFRSFAELGLWFFSSPFKRNNYFEPRADDNFETFLKIPQFAVGGFTFSSNRNKVLSIFVSGHTGKANEPGRMEYAWKIAPTIRANNRFKLEYALEQLNKFNDVGFTNYDAEGASIVGIRDWNTVTNTISFDHIFNDKNGLSARIRHYWSKVDINSYHGIGSEGELIASDYQNPENHLRFNSFTVDLVYQWNFAPGSNLVFVWKNNIGSRLASDKNSTFFEDLRFFGDAPLSNVFTMKMIYYLDYYTMASQNIKPEKKGRL
jgi:hypothetical protein